MRKKIGLLLLAILVVGSSADAKKGVQTPKNNLG